jgi:hypothetical protein
MSGWIQTAMQQNTIVLLLLGLRPDGQTNEILAVSGYFLFYVNLVLRVARVV